ncbi:hypothetical protein AB1Y20_023711 [Prymnesium parvum]|uniref:Kinesin-like protein n=1 Tax=Prymnesium parvum TaxID=97485 RepID=A0AB34JF56_PRYPA
MAPKKHKDQPDDDRLHVVVRIRPPVRDDEKFGEGSEALQVDKERNLLWLLSKDEENGKGASTKQYVFDRVLWKDSKQIDAWEAAGVSVTKGAMEGYQACVMCYGQTGAGKSYTLANNKPGSEGIMVQAFNYIFETAAQDRSLKYEIHLSFVQIYLDNLSDLLQPSNAIEIREDPKDGVYVAGVTWEPVSTTQQAMNALDRGNRNRATASTRMNADSSRSHACLMLSIKCTGGPRTLIGKLYLVDLAGSERVKKSGVEGSAFDEAKAINQSLTTLGRCIEILASGKKERPPFRESKLTRLLSNAIGGGAKTTLIVCVAPTVSDQFETVNSLEFGLQAMNVIVKAKINASTDYNSLTASLMNQRDMKLKPLRELECKVLQELQPQLDEVIELELQCKELALQIAIAEEQDEQDLIEANELKAQAKRDEEEHRRVMAKLNDERSHIASELEQVLLRLSDNPEMARIQKAHEAEKEQIAARSRELQDSLHSAELRAAHEQQGLQVSFEGAMHTARNLGQIAAYLLQTGSYEEAADFYSQAKAIFDATLGPGHEKTLEWQQDLFFLINAPTIQRITRSMSSESVSSEAASAHEWWVHNLQDKSVRATESTDGEETGLIQGWWMQNLFDMKTRSRQGGDEAGAYLSNLFAKANGEQTIFTPRGTISGAAGSLPQPSGAEKPDIRFASSWVERVFQLGDAADQVEEQMGKAVDWLAEAFGTHRGKLAPQPAALPKPMGTPRSAASQQADDAAVAAAVHAALATPRGMSDIVDDRPMAGAFHKMFHSQHL